MQSCLQISFFNEKHRVWGRVRLWFIAIRAWWISAFAWFSKSWILFNIHENICVCDFSFRKNFVCVILAILNFARKWWIELLWNCSGTKRHYAERTSPFAVCGSGPCLAWAVWTFMMTDNYIRFGFRSIWTDSIIFLFCFRCCRGRFSSLSHLEDKKRRTRLWPFWWSGLCSGSRRWSLGWSLAKCIRPRLWPRDDVHFFVFSQRVFVSNVERRQDKTGRSRNR